MPLPRFSILPWLCLFALPGSGAVSLGQAQGAERLQWSFEPGQTLRYVRQQSRVVDVQDRPRFQTTERITDLRLIVESVNPDGSARITQTIDRLQYRVLGPDGAPQVDFDSARDENAPPRPGLRPAEHLRVLVGASCTYDMEPNGLIRDVQISEATRKILAEQPPAVAQVFNENAFKLLAPAVTLPKEEVEPGVTWTEKAHFANPLVGDTELLTTYRYKGVAQEDGQSAHVIEASIDFDLKQDPEADLSIQVQEFSNEGAIRFDNEAGHLLERVNRETLRSTSTINGQAIEQTVKGNEITRLVPEPEPEAEP